jgi:tetratricopeptide (TPR) repeat protein
MSERKQDVLKKRLEEEMGWRRHEYERLTNAGQDSFSYNDYLGALTYFNQALSFEFEERAALGKARCLIELGQLPEAVELLKELTKKIVSADGWRLLVETQLKLHRYADAMASADGTARVYPEQLAYVLRSQVYLAQGARDAAKACLLNGYRYCKRTHADKMDIEDALYAIGVAPPKTVSSENRGNGTFLAALDLIASLDHPLNEREASAVFDRTFDADGFANIDMPVSCWRAVDKTLPVESIVLSSDHGALDIQANQDQTCITENTLVARGAQLLAEADLTKEEKFYVNGISFGFERPVYAKYMRCGSGGVVLEFESPNDDNTFENNSADYRLRFARRHFAPPSSFPPTLPEASLQEHIHAVESMISNGQYDSAATEVFAHWNDRYLGHSSPAHQQAVLLKKKQLLISCYKEKPEIQQYLRFACIDYIGEDIDQTKHTRQELPTIVSFLKNQWHVFSNVIDPALKDSRYIVWADTYPAIWVPQSCQLFKNIYLEQSHSEKARLSGLIKAIKGDLLEEAQLQAKESELCIP